MVLGDFAALQGGEPAAPPEKKPRTEASREPRPWLRVFETLPPQMLNAYGVAQYSQLSDKEVWGHMVMPLVTGAMFMTEYASKDEERRGVAINRWLMSVLLWCQYQKQSEVMTQNKFILGSKYEEVYAEIERVYPSLESCLAPKKSL